jgi:integrase
VSGHLALLQIQKRGVDGDCATPRLARRQPHSPLKFARLALPPIDDAQVYADGAVFGADVKRINRDQLAEIDLHWHDLRHEAACRWLSRGRDLRAIQLLLGHADLKTTQRYLNVTDEELRKTMQQKLWSRKSWLKLFR